MTPAQLKLMTEVARNSPIEYLGHRRLKGRMVPIAWFAHLNTIRACVARGWLEWATWRDREDSVQLTDEGRAELKRATFKIAADMTPREHPQCRSVADPDLMTYTRDTVGRAELAAKVRAYFEAFDGRANHFLTRENALRAAVGLEPRK